MKNPLVSVIVPNYNYARYLDERMESILNQSYQNFEVIILDDKSTDHSLDVINQYQSHPKVSKIIANEVNSGSPFKQWERGISESSGDIIWIAESDDTCSLDFLEKLVPIYLANESALAFCHSILVDENGQKLRENHQMKDVTSDFSMDGKAFIKKYLAYSNEIQNASCAIFSKKAAQEIDKDYMNYQGAGDWFFWILLAEKGNVSFVSATCNHYRLHQNTTRKVVRSGLEFHEIKTIYEWLLRNDYLDDQQFRRCKLDNLSLMASLDEIPCDIKKGLFKMWNVTFYEQMSILFRNRMGILKRSLLKIL